MATTLPPFLHVLALGGAAHTPPRESTFLRVQWQRQRRQPSIDAHASTLTEPAAHGIVSVRLDDGELVLVFA